MLQMNLSEVLTCVVILLAGVAWFIRLESAVKRAEEKIAEAAEALKESENRMSKLDDKVAAVLTAIYAEIKAINQSMNDKFTSTSNEVAKIQGMLIHKEN